MSSPLKPDSIFTYFSKSKCGPLFSFSFPTQKDRDWMCLRIHSNSVYLLARVSWIPKKQLFPFWPHIERSHHVDHATSGITLRLTGAAKSLTFPVTNDPIQRIQVSFTSRSGLLPEISVVLRLIVIVRGKGKRGEGIAWAFGGFWAWTLQNSMDLLLDHGHVEWLGLISEPVFSH